MGKTGQGDDTGPFRVPQVPKGGGARPPSVILLHISTIWDPERPSARGLRGGELLHDRLLWQSGLQCSVLTGQGEVLPFLLSEVISIFEYFLRVIKLPISLHPAFLLLPALSPSLRLCSVAQTQDDFAGLPQGVARAHQQPSTGSTLKYL